MAFTPVQYTNGSETRTASTPTDAVQLEYDGWWVSGTVEPALPLIDRFRFGPTPPPVAERRRGMIYIATPV